MKILVVGNGGREHALIWKLAQSARKPEILCAPGNAGIAKLARCVDISATDIEKLADLAKRERVDLTIVGPEAPLCAGIVDYFEAKGLEAFGPKKLAAALEGDKVFAKEIMARHSIPTAAHRTFSELEPAIAYVNETVDYPMVVKASGLAAGKGVIICRNVTEAKEALLMIMSDRSFGAA
ncbi:MAG: phosphoribosylamine--glycine ligase, partial [Planctomycetes bacterium]|nr:phosphoribosylamine--glycine ligase [Planctomycetota bacterium]